MKLYNAIYVATIATLCSCGGNKSAATYTLNTNFEKEITATDTVLPTTALFSVDRWCLHNNELVILSRNTDKVLFRLDASTGNVVDSIGRMGEGPDEFVAPELLNSREIMVADNVKRCVFNVTATGISKADDFGDNILPINYPFTVDYPYLGYVTKVQTDHVVFLQDITTGEVTDSLNLADSELPQQLSSPDCVVTGNSSHMVCAWQGTEKFWIASVSDHKISQVKKFIGSSEVGNTQFYYVGADCGENGFALLSMKGVDPTAPDVKPNSVEIYDYDGTPKLKINLNFIAYSMLYDEANNRVFLLSMADEQIHVVNF
jgi:hypothetical protein